MRLSQRFDFMMDSVLQGKYHGLKGNQGIALGAAQAVVREILQHVNEEIRQELNTETTA